jgi:glycerol-3-phosphate acyltransferase PlsY
MPDILLALMLIIGGYLFGSIPTGYLAGKWIKGIDLRQYGSGTVSGSMVYEHISIWAVIPVGLFDIFKGALPTWLGIELGGGMVVAVLAGLAAVIGHNWPVYLNFTGGRGLSPFMGMLLVVFPWGVLWVLGALAIGFLLGDSAPVALLSLITLPVLVNLLDGSPVLHWAAAGMAVITLIKRLEANGRPLPAEASERQKVILLRLIFDRDIRSHTEWIRRTPDQK